MGKFFKVIPSILFFVSIAAGLSAQNAEVLPDDPRIKTGRLANGLSYYIVKNQTKKGYADFGLIQKTGTVLEEDGGRGMFAMLERLAMKGTRNFTDSTITAFFNSLGIAPLDIVFDTREDDITYLVKNIPVKNPNIIDSSLLVLYNWMSSINIDEEDIMEEIPYLKNRMESARNARTRMDARLMKRLFPRSPYAALMEESATEDIDALSSKELRNFYYKWFRPDLQAVAVIGDVDPESMETRIKSVFSTIPKPLKGQKRPYYTPQTLKGVQVCLLKDKEYGNTRVEIDYLKKPLPDEYRNTNIPFVGRYMNNTVCRLFADRIREEALAQGIPIYNIEVRTGKFMNMRNRETVSIAFETLPATVYSALSFVKSEIDRLKEYGFTNREFFISKDIFFRDIEFTYNLREQADNRIYWNRVRDHYLEGYSLASIEMEYELAKEILSTVTRDELDSYAGSLFDQTDDIVLSCRMPDAPGPEDISLRRMSGAFNNALTLAQTSDMTTEVLRWPGENYSGGSSRIVSEVSDPVSGSRILILSNGATAILKKTGGSLDTISFRAVSKGGLSLLPEVNFSTGEFINGVLELGGLGNISRPGWNRLYAYENIYSSARIFPERERVEGWALKGDEEKLFQLLNLNFTARREDYNAYDLYKKEKVYQRNYISLSPEDVFRDSTVNYNFNNRRYIRRPSAGEIESTNYQSLLTELRNRFSNAADFTFIFAGDMEEHRFRDLAVKYIGSLPGDVSRRENWLVVPNYFTKGRTREHFLYQMEAPRTYASITYSNGCPYQLENLILGEILQTYLRRKLDAGKVGNFSPKNEVQGKMYYYPEEIFVLNLRTDAPDIVTSEKIADMADAVLNEIPDAGTDRVLFDQILSGMEKSFNQKSSGNGYWLDVLEQRYIVGKDFHSNYLSALGEITPEKFEDFVRSLLAEGNRIEVVMEGTTEDVNSPDLMKDNAFIRDYFGE